MDIRLLIVVYLMICILPVVPSPYRSRSRNKNSAPTYDQKQTGEYNIQLHLKDFEVVALLSDSAFTEGDYDYNYDYSELTVKPSTGKPSTTTSKPSPKPELTTVAQTTMQTTPEVQSTTLQQSPTTIQSVPTTIIIKNIQTETSKVSTTEKSTTMPVVSISTTLPTVRLENELEGNITKEDILKQSTVRTEIIVKPIENLTIIDKEQSLEENLPLVVHRKCASGFTRDKNGRCRRVRRPPPQFSFGISRLANLASKLRQGTNDSQTNESIALGE